VAVLPTPAGINFINSENYEEIKDIRICPFGFF